MDRAERIQYIQQRLTEANGPVRGSDLAEECQVTRQVIVGDIAHMRAMGQSIQASPRGYRLTVPRQTGVKALLASQLSMDHFQKELYTIVDLGGAVLNVSVEHRFYGYICLDMNVRSREDVDHFLEELRRKHSTALTNLKDGFHRCLVEAKTTNDMHAIRTALSRLEEETRKAEPKE